MRLSQKELFKIDLKKCKRKNSYTSLLSNYNVNCFKIWKSRLIFCLLYRAKLICSNSFLFFYEVGVLKNIFVLNGYPLWFFEKCFKKFNEKFLYSHSAYFGHDSRRFINKLQNIINSKLKFNMKINPIYKIFKVLQYF